MTSTAQQIRDQARQEFIEPALARGESRVTILARDLVQSLHLQNRTPAVCSALRSKVFLQESHLVLESQEGPPSGMSTTMRFTYRLLDSPTGTPDISRFERLKGIGEKTFRSLGGGSAFIEEERARFGKP
jgi:hypothetical protein